MNAGRDLYARQTQQEPPDPEPIHTCRGDCTTWMHPGYKSGVRMSTPDSRESHKSELEYTVEWQGANVRTPAGNDIVQAIKDYAGRGYGGTATRKEHGYISGPMRGHDDLNHASFDGLAAALEEDGNWIVHSPAATNREYGHTPETPYAECIRLDVQSLLESDAIFLLKGWRQSEGARFEAEIARSFGLKFYEAHGVPGTLGVERTPVTVWAWEPFDPKELGVEGIDQEARRLVYGDRAATYGHPRGDFDTIAKMWTGILLKKLRAADADEITGEEVALMMSALKLARLASTPTHHDSQVDTIGYMLCLARLQEDPKEIAAWDAMAKK